MTSDQKQAAALVESADAGCLIVVDGSLAQLDQLLLALGAQAPVLVLDPSADPIAQILKAAADQGPLDAIHLLSHGRSGSIQIAGQSYGAEQLASLGKALVDGGDLLLYGCHVASGSGGTLFLERLAQFTGADVAASTDRTGVGGNWTLEAASGAIEARALSAPAWEGNLADPTLTFTSTSATATFNEGSRFVTFKIGGTVKGGKYALMSENVTTSGIPTQKILYSNDSGASWQTYPGSMQSLGSDILVAVATDNERDWTSDPTESFKIGVQVAQSQASYVRTDIPGFTKVTAEPPGYYSSLEPYTTEFTCNDLAPGVYNNIRWQGVGTFVNLRVAGPDGVGDAEKTNYVARGGSQDNPAIILKLDQPSRYIGFWWAAADPSNVFEIWSGGVKKATFTTAYLLGGDLPNGSTYTPSIPFPADALGKNPAWWLDGAQYCIEDEFHSFLNFYAVDAFDELRVYGQNFESDNWTVRSSSALSTPPEQPAPATITDDGKGDIVMLDAKGLPLVTAAQVQLDPDATKEDDSKAPVLAINNVTVNEYSDYMVFKVTGGDPDVPLALTILATQNPTGNATPGDDFDADYLEYWSEADQQWLKCCPGDSDPVRPDENGELLVPITVNYDNSEREGPETMQLVVRDPVGSSSVVGTGTIVDDGTGQAIYYNFADDKNFTSYPQNDLVNDPIYFRPSINNVTVSVDNGSLRNPCKRDSHVDSAHPRAAYLAIKSKNNHTDKQARRASSLIQIKRPSFSTRP